MKPTNKCKEDFEEFLFRQHRIQLRDGFTLLPEICQASLILEFFDAQKIFINIKSKFGNNKQRERFSYNLFSFNSGFMWDSRQEALNEAIVNANNFYNKNR